MSDVRESDQQAARWVERLASGETVHTGRSRLMLILVLVLSGMLCALILWGIIAARLHRGMTRVSGLGWFIVLPFLWLHYLFAEIRFGEDRFEYRDWMLQPRRRRVDFTSVAALARWPTGGRKPSPALFFCYSPSWRGDDLKWVRLNTDFWPDGLEEAVRREIARRGDLTESSSAGPDGMIWRRPGDKRELPALPSARK